MSVVRQLLTHHAVLWFAVALVIFGLWFGVVGRTLPLRPAVSWAVDVQSLAAAAPNYRLETPGYRREYLCCIVSFSPDGSWLVTKVIDVRASLLGEIQVGPAQVWNAYTGEPITTLRAVPRDWPPPGRTDWPSPWRRSPRWRAKSELPPPGLFETVMSWFRNGAQGQGSRREGRQMLDTQTGKSFFIPCDLVCGFDITFDGSRIAVMSTDKSRVEIWDLPPRRPIVLLLTLAAVPSLLFTFLLWWRFGR